MMIGIIAMIHYHIKDHIMYNIIILVIIASRIMFYNYHHYSISFDIS